MGSEFIKPEEKDQLKPGTLYLVSTPIGNLRDITLRALDILSGVDLIVAEDTRTSKILLDAYQVRTPVISYHDFNKERVTPGLIARLKADQSVAVISDAGTPGISDPAFYLVRQAIAENITIRAIPGATAFTPALIVSGLPTDRFVFEGFLPPKKGRQKRLQELSREPRTIILYESPRRVLKTLKDLYAHLGDRRVCIVREITKKFEQIIRSTLAQITNESEEIILKGEFVILVEGYTRKIKHEQQKLSQEKGK